MLEDAAIAVACLGALGGTRGAAAIATLRTRNSDKHEPAGTSGFSNGACRDRTGDLQLAKRGLNRMVEPFSTNRAKNTPLQSAGIRSS